MTSGGVKRYTRPHDLAETIHAYDQAMMMWEDRTRFLKLGEPTDVVSFDDLLSKMIPKRKISFEQFTSILAPRVKTSFPVSKGASK